MSAPHQEHRDGLRQWRNALSAVSLPQGHRPKCTPGLAPNGLFFGDAKRDNWELG